MIQRPALLRVRTKITLSNLEAFPSEARVDDYILCWLTVS